MALTTSLPYLSLLLLAVTTLTSCATVDPTLQATYRCNPRDDRSAHRTFPMSCAVAVIQLPDSVRGIDWHGGRRGAIVYDRPLTSTGDPNAPNHLPKEMVVGGCQVRVELRPRVQSANVVWEDLRLFALGLIRRCIGDERMLPARESPGTGGTCDVAGVRITIGSVGPGQLVEPSSSSSSGLSVSDSSWSSSLASDRAEGMDATA